MEPVLITDLLEATRARAHGLRDDAVVRRVTTDSRAAQPGDLFWALKGNRHDGHEFTSEALKRGALACVVEEQAAQALAGPAVVVHDSLRALGDFARWYRHHRESLIIGVTGSVGKTTTREMLYSVLSARHTGMRSRHNFNNEIGLPLSLLELRTEDEFGVLEMGAARIGDIRELCEIACPEVGVITRIGPAHLTTFGSLAGIYQGKGELLEALPPHGFAVVGGDDDEMRAMAARSPCSVIFVGEKAGNQLRALDVEFRPGRLKFCVDRRKYEVPAPARHYLTAALCAVAVGREIGMDAAGIAEGLRNFEGVPARCQVEQVGSWTLIDDTYNASPLSMQAACLCLQDWPTEGRRLLIAGDMLELGDHAERCHAELGACVASTRIDRLLAIGEQADHVADGAVRAGMSPHRIADCHSLDSLLAVLDCWLEPGDVVLIKGSRGMKMERVVQWLKQQGAGPAATRTDVRAVA